VEVWKLIDCVAVFNLNKEDMIKANSVVYSDMENSKDIEVELYEEIVRDPNIMNVSPSSSTEDVRELPPSQEPMPYCGNTETSLATTPRSALRPQLAGYPLQKSRGRWQ